MANEQAAPFPRLGKRMDIRELFKDQFECLAIFICRHSWKFCFISFFFSGFLGLGMLNFRPSRLLNNVIKDLYIPTDTPTTEIAERLASTFPDKSGYDFYAHQNLKQPLFGEMLLWRHDLANILERTNYDTIMNVVNYVKNIYFLTDNGVTVYYKDLCARRNGKCVIDGQEIIEQIEDNTNENIDIGRLHQRNGHHYDPSIDSLAKYEVVNRTLKSAKYIKIVYHLRHDTDNMILNANGWQRAFATSMKNLLDNNTSSDVKPLESLGLVYQHAHSFYDELGEDTFADIPYMSFVFTVFLTYVGFVTSGGNSLSKRMNVARMGYIATPISVLGAWGLLMAVGIEFTNAIGLVPLFLCCAQLINTFITLSHLSDSYSLETATERVIYAMRNSAIPITMTTVIHIVSFSIGIVSKLYVLKLVCIYFVSTLVFGYLNHFIFFMSCVAIHEQRIDKGIHFCCCCTRLRPKEGLKENNRSCCIICCCSGEKPETREDTESRLERVPRKLMTQFILTSPVKVVCVISLLIYTGICTYGLANYNIDVLQYSDVNDGSYFSKWQSRWSEMFENKSTVQFIIKHPDGFLRDRELMDRLHNSLIMKEYLQSDSFSAWYMAFNNENHNVSTEADLIKAILQEFLPQNPVYSNDIALATSRKRVIMSRVYIQTKHVVSTKAMISLKEDLTHLIGTLNAKDDDDGESRDSEEIDPYVVDSQLRTYIEDKFIVHSPDFLLTDWFKLPLWEILRVCSVQFILLLFFLLLLNPNFVLPIAIVIGYASNMGGMFGICHFFGVTSLNVVSFISFLIASSFSVEVVGHSINSLMTVTGTDRGARTNVVLNTVTQALFHPLFGLTLGLIVLVVVESYFFRSVFIIFVTTTAICIVNAVFFLPACMSMLGPGNNMPAESVDFFKPQTISNENVVNELALIDASRGVTADSKSYDTKSNGETNDAFYM